MEDIGIRRRRFGPAHLRIGVFAAAWGPRLSTLDTRACVTGRALQESCDATGSTGSMGTASAAALAVNSFHQRNQSAQRLFGGAVSDSKSKICRNCIPQSRKPFLKSPESINSTFYLEEAIPFIGPYTAAVKEVDKRIERWESVHNDTICKVDLEPNVPDDHKKRFV
jgi:hypothetical protein